MEYRWTSLASFITVAELALEVRWPWGTLASANRFYPPLLLTIFTAATQAISLSTP